MRDNIDNIVTIYNPPGMEDYGAYKTLQEAPIVLEVNIRESSSPHDIIFGTLGS
jgi:hypothetical protein